MDARALALVAASVALATAAACSAAPQARIGVDAPAESQFPPVADYLDHRCGTLDCHGQIGRNLRMWGCDGLRLSASDLSGCVSGPPTTPDEYEATYRSLVGLEPAVMSAVVHERAVNPNLLTFVRKATGVEGHKGGQLITSGDDQYKCVVSWLAGNTNMTACGKAINYPLFPQPGAEADASFE
jgi:hypothetical protein